MMSDKGKSQLLVAEMMAFLECPRRVATAAHQVKIYEWNFIYVWGKYPAAAAALSSFELGKMQFGASGTTIEIPL